MLQEQPKGQTYRERVSDRMMAMPTSATLMKCFNRQPPLELIKLNRQTLARTCLGMLLFLSTAAAAGGGGSSSSSSAVAPRISPHRTTSPPHNQNEHPFLHHHFCQTSVLDAAPVIDLESQLDAVSGMSQRWPRHKEEGCSHELSYSHERAPSLVHAPGGERVCMPMLLQLRGGWAATRDPKVWGRGTLEGVSFFSFFLLLVNSDTIANRTLKDPCATSYSYSYRCLYSFAYSYAYSSHMYEYEYAFFFKI